MRGVEDLLIDHLSHIQCGGGSTGTNCIQIRRLLEPANGGQLFLWLNLLPK